MHAMFRRHRAAADFGRGRLLNVEGDYDSMIEKRVGGVEGEGEEEEEEEEVRLK